MNRKLKSGFFVLMMIFISLVDQVFSQERILTNQTKASPFGIENCEAEELFETLTINYQFLLSNQGVKYCLPGLNVLFEHTNQIPSFNQNLATAVFNSKENFTEMFHYGFRLLGATAGGFGPPLAGIKNKLKSEFKSKNLQEKEACLFAKVGFYFMGKSKAEWVKMPVQLRQAILELIFTIDEAGSVIQQFNKPLVEDLKTKYPDFKSNHEDILMEPWLTKQLLDFSIIDIIEKVDLKKLSFANTILNEGIRDFLMVKREITNTDFDRCIIETKWGKVGLYGSKNDIINDDYCLLIDFGGNETYTGNIGSSLSPDKPIGISIDFEGDDIYIGEGSLAKGVLGIGVLFDLQGNDKYRTESAGLASSLFGSSILYDQSGNDEYFSNANYSQGAALIGSAILCDLSGDDIYKSKSYSQAYGGTMGCGLLIDFQGNDIYGENKNMQNSFVQGAASGRWAEATDGQSLAGGIGMLMDFSGDDQYFAASFSQAASYYFGLGLVYDGSGNDTYNAVSHSQGYAAHYALSAFIENQGVDLYNRLTNEDQLSQIIGSGRDFASGWLIDFEGNDEYHFGNRSAGIGDMNGIGVFMDKQGDDAYFHHKNKINKNSPSLGKSIEMDDQMMINFRIFKPKSTVNMGLHIDSTGINTFKVIQK